jgi:hypothetical protein
MPTGRFLAAALFLIAVAGCADRPRAPALQDEPVFQNKQEGLRFLPPSGWRMRARTEVPHGPLTEERLLVQYNRLTPDSPANLEVTMADVPPSTPLDECAGSRSDGPEGWQKTATEPLEVSGLPAFRATFAGTPERAKEVVVVRRGDRVYYFTAIFPAKDAKARDQVRKAVASAAW